MRSFGVLSLALTLTLFLAPAARGQSAPSSVTLGGRISEAVFITVAPDAQLSGDQLPITHTQLDAHTVRLSLHTSGTAVKRISVPLLLRSNAGYTLSASASVSGAGLRGLCVASARATGALVFAGAIKAPDAASCNAAATELQTRDVKLDARPSSLPHTLWRGPRISRAGTFDNPSNALELSLLVEVEPHAGQERGGVELILTATPGGGVNAGLSDAGAR